ncbi:hypothetical protein QQM79_18815 [Marinobacteraceae bacterium S3BR75-40.1]
MQRLALQWLAQLDDGVLAIDQGWRVWVWNARLAAITRRVLRPGSALNELAGFDQMHSSLRNWFEQTHRQQTALRLEPTEAAPLLEMLILKPPLPELETVLYPLVVGEDDLIGIQLRSVIR